MATGGGKGGKAFGEGHGAGGGKGGRAFGEGLGAGGEGPETPVRWLAQDIRETGHKRQEKPAGQPRPRKLLDCTTCEDLCCGLARELVSEAFELGEITMSRKVILIFV